MRTIAYIDGYDLYFGCLKGTPYEWLDVAELARTVLRIQGPTAVLSSVRYFSAPIKSRVASRGEVAMHAQARYHRALRARGVGLCLGSHSLEAVSMMRVEPKLPPSKSTRT